MTIGLAPRLEACRSSVGNAANAPPDLSFDTELSLRCRWSVYILVTIFSPGLCTSNTEDSQFPTSAPVPPKLPSNRSEDYPSDLYTVYGADTD